MRAAILGALVACLLGALSPTEAAAMAPTSYNYSASEANISIWLSAAAYCDSRSFKHRTFEGPTHGFVVTKTILDAETDTVGFIGFLNKMRRIYVVFRGTASAENYLLDTDIAQVRYGSYPPCGCMVHEGFYSAEQAVIGQVVREVVRVMNITKYSVAVTGHSLGGALAHLTALDLLNAGVVPVVYTFGQPRVGDISFANLIKTHPNVPRGTSLLWRVTHDRDIVPHLPLGDNYYHACREAFQAGATAGVRLCSSLDCQDPSCSMKYVFPETSIADHSRYLGLDISCDAVSN